MAAQAAGEDRGSLLAVIGDEVLARNGFSRAPVRTLLCCKVSAES